ncbi:MAG: aminoacyl-histidine dipeptidase [Deltaproteobacteria bacterium]|nr:MAG: aminoacyl-histidine dipeptidase [Deltaproteobacteria bacterium]
MDRETRAIIDYFERINRIPRCSTHEARLGQWLQQWAADRSLPYQADSAGNLVIQVPASSGYEHFPCIVIQGHMDMVCEKNAGSDHDFATDPILMYEDGDWLMARETTLGADNGIAIALALALVDNPKVRHPALELFFTVNEETGLTGVMQMDPALLSGKILINLDSEDEGVFVVGCSGGRNTAIQRPLAMQPLDDAYDLLHVTVRGMRGGHSGVDIAKGRANANRVMARLLNSGGEKGPLRLVRLKGGTGRNVIPRACEAVIACRGEDTDRITKNIVETGEVIRSAYMNTDPGLCVQVDPMAPVESERPEKAVSQNDTQNLVDLLAALPSGPVGMNPNFPQLVQTSANLAMVEIRDGVLAVTSSQRSSDPDCLDAVCLTVESVCRLAGATAETNKGYPSWPMDGQSALLKRCQRIYRELFGSDATIQIMHAGLECGVIGDRCPGMDMISLGPTLENPHSPSERLHLPSVGKVWRLLVALLGSYAEG